MNSVATKTSIVETKVEKNYKKNVATHKIMSRHNEELKVEISITSSRDKKWKGKETTKTSLSGQRFQCYNK